MRGIAIPTVDTELLAIEVGNMADAGGTLVVVTANKLTVRAIASSCGCLHCRLVELGDIVGFGATRP